MIFYLLSMTKYITLFCLMFKKKKKIISHLVFEFIDRVTK